MPTVVELLKREAASISRKINPFDASLRRPAQSLSGLPSTQRIATVEGAAPS
jgi:hypothetical protein